MEKVNAHVPESTKPESVHDSGRRRFFRQIVAGAVGLTVTPEVFGQSSQEDIFRKNMQRALDATFAFETTEEFAFHNKPALLFANVRFQSGSEQEVSTDTAVVNHETVQILAQKYAREKELLTKILETNTLSFLVHAAHKDPTSIRIACVLPGEGLVELSSSECVSVDDVSALTTALEILFINGLQTLREVVQKISSD